MNRKGFSELLLLVILAGVLALGAPLIFKLRLAQPKTPEQAPVVSVPTSTQTTTSPIAQTSTQQIATPSPYPEARCITSKEPISTSTWKTFNDPGWAITFQYPQDWHIDNTQGYIALSGKGINFTITTLDEIGPGLLPDAVEESYYCPRTVVGQSVNVGAYVGVESIYALTRAFSIKQNQEYGVYFSTPPTTASTTDPILYTLLGTMHLVK